MTADVAREKIEAWLKQGALAAAKDMRVGEWPALCDMALRSLDAPRSAIREIEVIDPYVMDLVRKHGSEMTNSEIVAKFLPKERLATPPAERAAAGSATEPRDVLLGESLLQYTLRNFNECCTAWSDVRGIDGNIDVAKAEYASAVEGRVRSAIKELVSAAAGSVTQEPVAWRYRIFHPTYQRWGDWRLVPYKPQGDPTPNEFEIEPLAAAPQSVPPSVVPLDVRLCSMGESNGNLTWIVQLARSAEESAFDALQIYADPIKGRAEYERDRLKHFFGQGPEPDILAYDTADTNAPPPEERDTRDAVLFEAAKIALCGPQTIDVKHLWPEDWVSVCGAGKIAYANRAGENDMAQHVFKLIAAEMLPDGRARYMPHAGLPDTPDWSAPIATEHVGSTADATRTKGVPRTGDVNAGSIPAGPANVPDMNGGGKS